MLQWVMPEVPADEVERLAAELSLHPLAARILVHRGYRSLDAASRFLSDDLKQLPDPSLMKGLDAACERLVRAILSREKVTLWGDYDVDGVSSTALLSSFLINMGANVATYIPHRLGEGYGLNSTAIERIAGDGTRLLVTLDCGITSHAEVALANARGLEVVVVDHHAVPEVMPPALAVLNPLQPGCEYPTKFLCAAGVAFNLCIGLRRLLRERGHFNEQRPEPNLRTYMDLVALATVADVVPLVGVNRLLVKHGLKELTKAQRPGVKALKEVSGLSVTVTSGDVGFRLGPRINAAGRLDDASLGLQCLLAKTYEAALPLARALDEANAERQAIEKAMLSAAFEQAQTRVEAGARGLVLHAEGWHPGVVGIVASRVVDRFHRPAVVVGVSDGIGRGSARSIEAFHLYDALKGCSEHLSRFGGHKHAAGLSIEAGRIDGFVKAFESVALERLQLSDLVARCKIDAVVAPEELSLDAVGALEALAPYGAGNPEPTIATRGVMAMPKLLANKKEGEPAHLKLRIGSAPQLDLIGFSLGEKASLVDKPVDLAFRVAIDEWNGVQRVGCKLRDVRAAEAV